MRRCTEPAERQIEVNNATGLEITSAFTERLAWQGIGDGWRHLHGSVAEAGVSFEWHDFAVREEFNWGKLFIQAASKSA